jgi:hypothetical protein
MGNPIHAGSCHEGAGRAIRMAPGRMRETDEVHGPPWQASGMLVREGVSEGQRDFTIASLRPLSASRREASAN